MNEVETRIETKREELSKLTIVQRCGFWTISWVILWAGLLGYSSCYVVENRGMLFDNKTTILDLKKNNATIDTKKELEELTEEISSSTTPYVQWKLGEFSAFTASEDETDSNPTIMASNREVYIGAIACPNGYSFGDRIEIKGMGEYICEDRMNIRYRDKLNFDIYIETKGEALNFGRKQLSFKRI